MTAESIAFDGRDWNTHGERGNLKLPPATRVCVGSGSGGVHSRLSARSALAGRPAQTPPSPVGG